MELNVKNLIKVISIVYFTQLFFTYYILELGFVGDASWYLKDSFNLKKSIINKYHVPFYSILIGVFRFITFNIINTEFIMHAMNFFSLVITNVIIYKILNKKISADFSYSYSLIFSFWPFMGITAAIMASADSIAIMLFLFGLYFLDKDENIKSMMMFSLTKLSSLTKKLFGGLLAIIYISLRFSKPLITTYKRGAPSIIRFFEYLKRRNGNKLYANNVFI